MIKSSNPSYILENPPEPKSEDEIIDQWSGDIENPLVSIQCITYNHAPYIESSINGFLMQETSFPFEIWIHDDASTDGTRDIVENYQKRYPRIIKTILQSTNQYSQGRRALSFIHGISQANYIAICEGDDYWTDPKKIQTQVDFLENNPEYVITGHDAIIIDENDYVVKESKLPDIHKCDYTGEELSRGAAWILTMSWMYRNVIESFAPERNIVRNGDKFLISILGGYGKSHYHDDIKPAAYRIHSGGVWSSLNNKAKLEDSANTFFWMYRYYKRQGEKELAELYFKQYAKKAIKLMKSKEIFVELIARILLVSPLKKLVRKLIGVKGVLRLKRLIKK